MKLKKWIKQTFKRIYYLLNELISNIGYLLFNIILILKNIHKIRHSFYYIVLREINITNKIIFKIENLSGEVKFSENLC